MGDLIYRLGNKRSLSWYSFLHFVFYCVCFVWVLPCSCMSLFRCLDLTSRVHLLSKNLFPL